MAAEKETIMVLKADLQCPCCYKKIRKTLCKFPQIRDQVYNEKSNEVTIKVVCCSPEGIRDKLCCKGGKSIKSIKILELPSKPAGEKPKAAAPAADKPKEKPEQPKAAAAAAAKPKDAEKPKDNPKGPEKPKDAPKGPEKPKGDDKPKAAPPPEKPKDAPKPEPAKVTAAMPPAAMQMMGPGPAIVHGVPSVFPYNGPSQDAYPPGPYYYGVPPPPQPIYDGYYGHGHGHGHGYGYGPYGGVAQHGHVNRDNYFSDENPQTCTIM